MELRPYSRMNQSELRREISQVLPRSVRIEYRPFSPTCRRAPVNPLRDSSKQLELEKFFAELNLYCGKCEEIILSLKEATLERNCRLNAQEKEIEVEEDQLIKYEQSVLEQIREENYGPKYSFEEVETHQRELIEYLDHLLAEIDQESFILGNNLCAFEIIAMAEQPPQHEPPTSLEQAPICPQSVYGDSQSAILANSEVICAAKRLVSFPGLQSLPRCGLYTQFSSFTQTMPDCSIIEPERIKNEIDEVETMGIPVVYPQLLDNRFSFITEASTAENTVFERVAVGEIAGGGVARRAVIMLQKARFPPEIGISVEECVHRVQQMALRFEEMNERGDREVDFLQFESDFEEEDIAETHRISALRKECQSLEQAINAQYEKRRLGTQLIADMEQFELLDVCCDELCDAVIDLARELGCSSPTGTAELTINIIKWMDIFVKNLLIDYRSFDKDLRRRARIRWIETMKQREIKESLKKQVECLKQDGKKISKRIPLRTTMLRSYNRPKTRTNEARRREMNKREEAEFANGGLFFK